MKLNWAERLVVNNPVRVMIQRRLIKWIKGVTRIAPQARILEIGCGRGAGACLIQEEFQPATLHAFDLDHRMIRLAGRYLKPEHTRPDFPLRGGCPDAPLPGRGPGRGLRFRGAPPFAGLAGGLAGDRPGAQARRHLLPGGVLSPVLSELPGPADLPAPGTRPLLQP